MLICVDLEKAGRAAQVEATAAAVTAAMADAGISRAEDVHWIGRVA